jgi:hypothetical protein
MTHAGEQWMTTQALERVIAPPHARDGETCLACGGRIAPVLVSLGSIHCHDCRDLPQWGYHVIPETKAKRGGRGASHVRYAPLRRALAALRPTKGV